MPSQAVKDYLKAIGEALRAGNATEHTHRPALKALLEAIGGTGVRATNEPKQVACGAPDFILTRGAVPLGYVEAKDVGADLRRAEDSEQLLRYRQSLGNLILTDYIEFRWFLDGELRLTASFPQPDRNGRIRWDEDAATEVVQLLQQFIASDIPLKSTPKDLATRMAGLALLIRDLISKTFKAEDAGGELHGQLKAFRRVLIESLTSEQFADMYAQTLCYGLFAARCNAPAAGFTRQTAANALPRTNPFLRKLFHSIAGPDLDERIAWAVDQLAELLARADMSAILADFGRRTRQEDPVVHFYETFLAAYDPKLREMRGVYYTPEPVVGYIVRSVDAILRRDFGMKEGLAHAGKIKLKRPKVPGEGKGKGTRKGLESYETHRLQILDPATGTGTFLYTVIHKIREHFKGNAGAWPGYVAEHLLPRLFGFELLMAPYAVAHMKLGLELEQTGYDFASDQRLGVYLTNSLEEASEMTGLPLFTQWLAEESRAAAEVKRDAPVMVVLGNPPYSGHSSNKGDWIEELMQDYKQSPELKKPAQAKWLSDDYVKFIRFAQWRIEQTGYGVLAFVTNHGYLDNPTFMDMRRSLLMSFDDIYLLDLHGNSKKKEKTPEGGKDENVFDIQQGVAIGIFVRRLNSDRAAGTQAQVHHADLFGLRAQKYSALDTTTALTTSWTKLQPASPTWLFVPQDLQLLTEYEQGISLRTVFSPNGDPAPGIVTTHDQFAVSWSASEAEQKVDALLATSTEEEARTLFRLCSQDQWRYERAKEQLTDGAWRDRVVPVLYRPFDVRWTVYDRNVAVHRRERASDHFLAGSNVGLAMMRQVAADQGFSHILAVAHIADNRAMFSSRGVMALSPLWLYSSQSGDLLDENVNHHRRPNLSEEWAHGLTSSLGTLPSPEESLAWIYAVLNAPSYRTRYADFLKRDFPRVPLTTNKKIFVRLVSLGGELIRLHTMQSRLPRITTFDVPGSNAVEKIRWTSDSTGVGRIYINAEQYFGDVPELAWETHIGGYQVAEKWLKDRRGRRLSYDDLEHYQSVIAVLVRTLEVQTEIDTVIQEAGGWPLQ